MRGFLHCATGVFCTVSEHYAREVAEDLLGQLEENARSAAETLAPPTEASDGETTRATSFREAVRRRAVENPAVWSEVYDMLAPVAFNAQGVTLRARVGLRNFHALVKDLRPDVYAAAVQNALPPSIPQEEAI